jgi:DNA helicase II / ATP-dependent DNA helicase PcrA
VKLNNFNKIYQILNKAQRKAVDAIDGPVMVVAGPGTGKTQVLAARIANILLKTDTEPSSILALTFTESAASNMRQRLVEMIGKTAYYVQISTFHSFCSDVIKTHPEYFPIERGSEVLSDLERYEIFQDIILNLNLKFIKSLNSPLFYLKDIIKAISDLKREGVSVKEFKEIVKASQENLESKNISKTKKAIEQKNINKNLELIKVYEAYQKKLRQSLRFDFDDMIALVEEAFEKEELLLREYQENLHYFLVDEFQDTNSAQNKVVNLLASYWGKEANIFVVGDPNQAIYRFQGASIENILDFFKIYPKSQKIYLDIGYRCSQIVYDAAHKLIKENKLELENGFKTKQKSISKIIKPINLIEAPSQTLEAVYLAEEINKLIKAKVKPENISILYRRNSDEEILSETLAKWDINFEVDSGSDVLKEEVIRQLLTFFQVISDIRTAGEDERLFEVMQYDWLNLTPLTVVKIARAAGKNKISLIDAINKDWLDITLLELQELRDFINKLYELGNKDAKLTFNSWFELVINESGFLKWLLKQPESIELLNNLNSLFKEIKSLTSLKHDLKLKDFLKSIETIKENKIKINLEDLNIKKNAVHLSTVHRAKGMEWDYVFLFNCFDGKWGNNKIRNLIKLPEQILTNTDLSKKEKNEDERRLFYVGLTRSKKQTIVSYPKTLDLHGRPKLVVASLFISEIGLGFRNLDLGFSAKDTEKYLEKLLTQPKVRKVKNTEKEFYQSLVKDFKLSVTALNSYLRDPKDFVENNLLRVPRAKPAPMAFGSAIHETLEDFYKYYLDNFKFYDLKKLLSIFNKALKKQVLEKNELEKRLEYGQEILQKYYLENKSKKFEPLFIERFVGTGARKAILDDIYLTGRLDRIDWFDKSKKQVSVIDYKTGRSKSINEIDGKVGVQHLSERELSLPENIRGPYKRQLLFYKLLTDLDRSFPYDVVEGMFDFVEPNKASAKFVQRKFILTKEDVMDLKILIKQVMKEIRNLEFLKEV